MANLPGSVGNELATRRRSVQPLLEQFEDRLVPTQMFLTAPATALRGTIVQVAINVDTLNDPNNGNLGLSAADADIFYNPAIFTVSTTNIFLGTIATGGSTANGEGYTPTGPDNNGWTCGPNNTTTPGEIQIGLSTTQGIISDSGSGTLVIINFNIKNNAALGASPLNLAADIFGNGGTNMSDENFNSYSLNPAPQDNVTSVSPYNYIGNSSDNQCDTTITIGGANQPPTAGNDSYSVTARSASNNASLTVGANAVQTLTFTGGPTAGSFTLAFGGETTNPINYSTATARCKAISRPLWWVSRASALPAMFR